ncbi:MAG: ferritin-like domain-containing protein [Xanthobacteraceae bacterium]
MAEPKIRIETREELVYLLAEAAAIEHNVMCCYLYAAWSLKSSEREGLTADQVAIVQNWKRAITAVAVEEMTHLTIVGNLASAIGAAPHLSRPNFPIPFGYHPSAIDLELFGFSHALIDHAIFLERPEGVDLKDAPEFVHPSNYHRTAPKEFIMPSAQDYLTIGHLYRGIMHGFEVLSMKLGEGNLFCGSVSAQIGPADTPLPGLCTVTDLATAEQAIETIIEQGEGAPAHTSNSHYQRFLNMRAQLDEILADDPDFRPAYPVARNPVMRQPIDAANRVWINDPQAARILDLANAIYGHMLRCLVQAYGRDADGSDNKRLLITLSRELMSVLTPVCEHLASLPANPDYPGIHAGMTFTMLRDIARLPGGAGEMRMLSERMMEMGDQAGRLFPQGHALDGIADTIKGMASDLPVADLGSPVVPVAAVDARPRAKKSLGLDEDPVGRAEGRDMVLSFDTRRCIHARFCVLGAPEVVLSGVEGQWLFPDKMETNALRAIVHDCPSGAIFYTPKGDAEPEPAPAVNTVSLRENGPYAIRARLKLNGENVGYRAALCRCGASNTKPFCDRAHQKLGFRATGEETPKPSQPLQSRDGTVSIEPQRNGPLQLVGNLEICTGTGRCIDRVTRVRLCRCGGSKTKPYCDNTHLKIGFKAD